MGLQEESLLQIGEEDCMGLMEEGLIEIGINEDKISDLSEKMETYINEIILFNSAYNLTNTSDHDELVIRHIFDSLAPYKKFCEIFKSDFSSGKLTDGESFTNENSSNGATYRNNNPFSVGDIGSGGGLPGIPLAAAFPEINFTLVERMSKRCAFLENVAAILGLKNVTVLCSEAEKLPKEKFDFITFRAFRPLDEKMTKTLLGITKTGGYLAAYKAKMENIEGEMNGIKSIVPEYKVIPLAVPQLANSERNLVFVIK